MRLQLLRERIRLVHAIAFTHHHADHLFGLDDARLFPDGSAGRCRSTASRRPRSASAGSSTTPSATGRTGCRRGSCPRCSSSGSSRGCRSRSWARRVLPIRLEHGPFAGAGVPGRRRWRTARMSAGSRRRAGRCCEGLDVLILDALRYEPHPTHFSLSEALAVVERAQAAADVLDAPVAQLRSWTDARPPAGARGAGLRWVDRGVLRDDPPGTHRVPSGRRVPVAWSRSPMSPEAGWSSAWSGTDRGTSCDGGASWTTTSAARLASEVASIDFDQLDRLIAELVRGEGGAGAAGRSSPADRGGPAAADRRRAGGAAARRRGRRRRAGRGRGRRDPGGRRLGHPPGLRRARRGRSRSGRSPRRACSRSTPRRSWRSARRHGRPLPLYIMTSPENHEATVRLLRRPTTASAWSTSGSSSRGRCRPSTGRSGKVLLADEGPRRALARRPRRDAGRPGRARARRRAELPGRDARAAACGRSSTSRWITRWSEIADPAFIGLHREADAEMSFKVVERLSPDEKLGVVVTRGRPAAGDRVLRPARRAGRPPRARGPAGALGRQHRRAHPRAVVHRAAGRASIACRSTARSRRCPTSTTRGSRSSRRSPTPSSSSSSSSTRCRWPSAGPWSRPTGPASSSRSRTPSGRTRRPRCTSG